METDGTGALAVTRDPINRPRAASAPSVSLRSPDALRDALYEAERIAEITALEVQALRDRIASDAFDGGRIRRGAMAAAKLGNRTNAYELGQALGELSRLRDAHRGAVANVRTLKG